MTGLVLDAGRVRGEAGSRSRAKVAVGAGSVRFEGISKTYRSSAGEVQALHAIDLDIPAGGIFGIIGRSGAGKSSLLRLINGLETPSEGRVLVDGEPVAALGDEGLVQLRRRIGMIFQHFNLLSAKTVRENVALPLRIAGVPKAEIAERVTQVLDLVGLEGKGDTYPSRLSGGQKQRVGIARALISRPEILLCDEATSALDPETTLSILRLLRDLNRRIGLTIVLITHEMSVIREICDRVLVLDQGRIAETGPVWQVFGKPATEAARALLGPVTHDLPEDLLARLKDHPAAPTDRALIALTYAGDEPEGALLPQSLADQGARLIDGTLTRVQGRSVGRLLLLTPSTAALPANAKVIGYVPADA